MTSNDITVSPFIYNGDVIRERPDMLCLTDIWKTNGSPSGRAPDTRLLAMQRLTHFIWAEQLYEPADEEA